jgi:hypothetical protein
MPRACGRERGEGLSARPHPPTRYGFLVREVQLQQATSLPSRQLDMAAAFGVPRLNFSPLFTALFALRLLCTSWSQRVGYVHV